MTLSALVHLTDMTAGYLYLRETEYGHTPQFDDIGDARHVIDAASIPALRGMLVTAVRLLAERVNSLSGPRLTPMLGRHGGRGDPVTAEVVRCP